MIDKTEKTLLEEDASLEQGERVRQIERDGLNMLKGVLNVDLLRKIMNFKPTNRKRRQSR